MVSGVQTATTRVNEDGIKILFNCPRRDLAQKAKSRGGTLVTRAYINKSTIKNLDLLEQGPRGIGR